MKNLLFFLCLFSGINSFNQTWQDVGGGTNNSSHAMCVWNGKLVDAGSFNNPCGKVATWNGAIWECLGGGVGLVGRSAIEWNGNLVVVGDFWNNFQPCTDCNGIGVWDGTSWSALGTGFNNDVLCLAIWNGDLVAGGDFTEADGVPCSRIARWDGTTWQPFGGPADFSNDIRCMVEFEGDLWVGGDFNNAGGCPPCDGVAKWNGTAWVGGDSGVDIQGGVDSTVRVLYVNPNDGNLYMGGHFIELNIDGVINTDFNGVAMYDGSVWTPLGTGVDSYVRMIHEYNGNLIVGGDFNNAGGTSANKIAKWNPITSSWSAMSTGMNGYVKSGTVFNGTLYAGGDFTTASGLTRNFIASWYEVPSVPPVANINSSGSSACAGNCISFSDFSTNSPTGWTWSFPGSSTPTSTAQNPGSICYPSAGNYTATLDACNGAGCDISTMNITITAIPTVTVNNPSICSGQSTTITATPSVGGGTYLWSPGGETTQAISVSPGTTSTYSVVYTLNSCSSLSANSTVTVTQTPTVSLNDATVCSGNPATITATPSVGGGSYLWSPDSQTSQVISVSPLTTTNYSVVYTLNGCPSLADISTVTVIQTPTLTVNSPSICEGDNAVLTATPSIPGGNFAWSPGGETTSSITVSPLITSTYSVIYTLNGCPSASYDGVVTVQEIPSVTVNDATICDGTTAVLTATPSVSGGNYSWTPDGQTSQAISVSPSTLSSYTVNYTLNGCTSADATSVVTVLVTPTVSVNDAFICAGDDAVLTGTPSDAGGDYLWSPDGQTTQQITVSPVNTTTYSLIYTLNSCASSSAGSTVTVQEIPIVSVNDATICEGATAILTATPSIAGGDYLWSPDAQTTQSISVSPTLLSNYTISYSINGCAGPDAIATVTVLAMPDINVDLSNNVLTSVQNGAAYQWLDCGNSFAIITGENAQSYTPSINGNFAVEINLNGCIDTSDCRAISTIGINELNSSGFSLYPNPATEQIFLSVSEDLIGSDYIVFDASGKLILTGNINSIQTTLQLEKLSPGIYYFQINEIPGSYLRFVKM